jgi:hypothetical protein
MRPPRASALLVCFLFDPASVLAQTTIHVPAGGNFQQAIDQAKPGDTITLAPGATYSGNYRLRKKSGDSYITITTADPNTLPPPNVRITPSDASSLPKIRTPNTSAAIATDNGAHHYRLVGLEILGPSGVYTLELIALGSTSATQLSDLASHIELDRLYIHGDPSKGGKRGISLNSISTVIQNCWISDFKSTTQDTQAIGGWNGPGPFTIVNNYLEAAGENLMFGGATPKINGLVPSDIVIRRNHFCKPLSWKSGDPSYAGTAWSVKNLFELKNARRVLVEENVFEHNWVGADQKSFAIVFTVRAQNGEAPWAVVEDVTFTSNVVRKSGSGINVLGKDTNSGGLGITRRVLLANNLFYDLDASVWGGDGRFLQMLEGAEDITINHNTCVQKNGNHVIAFGGAPSPRMTFTNNITLHGVYGVQGTGKATGLATLNYYAPDYTFLKNVLAGGNSSVYPPNNFFPSSLAQIGFVDPSNKDYRLSSTSPYRNAGTDGTDLGANVEAILTATRTVTDPALQRPQAPQAVSVTPSSGQGSPQTFQFVYSDANGVTDLAWVYALFNSTLNQAGACYVQYKVSENLLWLRNDAGTEWTGPVVPGAPGSLSNSQCTLNSSGSAVSGSGDTLTMTLELSFATAFSGTKNIYLLAIDRVPLYSNWQQRGTWLPAANSAPGADSVTPSSGTGSSQVFQFAYSDPNGYDDVGWAYALINANLSQAGACYFYYRQSQNGLWLRNDAGTVWLGPVTPGAAGTLSNSQCMVKAATASVTGSGNTLLLTLELTFDPSFAGTRKIHLYAADKGGLNSGWQLRGSWLVPGAAPQAVSVTPSSGTGSTQIFQFHFADANGFEDIGWTYYLFHTILTPAGGCYVYYKPGANGLWLRNDAGTAWLGPVTLGSSSTLSNSQCTLNASLSSAAGSGNNLSVSLALSFTTAFAGAKNIYMYAADKSGASSDWQLRGAWTVPGP